jgi:hypothetical protein
MTFKERYLLRMNGFFISSSFKARLFSKVVAKSFGEYAEVEKILRDSSQESLLEVFELSYQIVSPVISR